MANSFSLLGPSGCGKSTLLRIIAGLLEPDRGRVRLDGEEVQDLPAHSRRTAMVFQSYALFPHMTVERNTAFGLVMRGLDRVEIRRRVVFLPDHPWLPNNFTGREFLQAVGRLYDVEDARLMNHVERLLTVFELAKEGDWPIRSYSNGQQKKIAICSALVTEAPILLLDEPFSGGLDPAELTDLLAALAPRAIGAQVTVFDPDLDPDGSRARLLTDILITGLATLGRDRK